ncbi:hypothetical protein QFZ33_002132 [Arthrobacter globiformis]|nr:hypothetical protein [Arthrobacter globiformis]
MADIFIFRSWILSLSQARESTSTALGLTVAAAALASLVLGACFLLRSRTLHHPPTAPTAFLMRMAAGAVIVLAAATAASVFLGAPP